MKKRLIIYGVNYYPPIGGTSRVVENLILQLKHRYDITIYCYQNAFANQHIDGVKVVQFKPLASGSVGSLLYFFLSAMHILIFGKADIINAHKTDCAIFIPLLRLRFKVIATSHEAPYKRDKWNALQKFYFHLAELVFIKSSNVCTCISQPLSNYYKKRYDKEVHFIANGINVTKRPDYDYQRAESSLPVGASLYQPFILFSARRLMSTKGCHTMLEALHLINYKGQVFITGELENSPYLNKLKNLAEHLNVFFLGYVDPLNVLLALVDRSSLFIFPSETEGMSIMLLEVASVGKPIIASNIPENIQVFDGNEVLYFETGNAQDLAIKTAMAIDSLEYMQSLGLSARQKVYSSYLWRDIAKQYDKIFSSILK